MNDCYTRIALTAVGEHDVTRAIAKVYVTDTFCLTRCISELVAGVMPCTCSIVFKTYRDGKCECIATYRFNIDKCDDDFAISEAMLKGCKSVLMAGEF